MEDRIRKWLESQGYPLEMQVARSFQQAGFSVVQSEFYEDPETSNQREIDVTASLAHDFTNLFARIEFVIQCKASPDKPWVLFTSNRSLADPARVAQRAGSTLGSKLLCKLAHNKDIQSLPLFQFHERPAYGLTQAFTTGHDVTYSAATSVSKAVAAEIKRADFYTSHGHPICLMVFPMIVIDGQLMEAYLRDDGDVAINRVDSGTLVWRNRIVGEPHTIINIARREGIDIFAREAFQWCRNFFELVKESVNQLKLGNREAT